jgi:hypothetical protein
LFFYIAIFFILAFFKFTKNTYCTYWKWVQGVCVLLLYLTKKVAPLFFMWSWMFSTVQSFMHRLGKYTNCSLYSSTAYICFLAMNQ